MYGGWRRDLEEGDEGLFEAEGIRNCRLGARLAVECLGAPKSDKRAAGALVRMLRKEQDFLDVLQLCLA